MILKELKLTYRTAIERLLKKALDQDEKKVILKNHTSSDLIVDEIDRALAQHYGFRDEELDFVINYDIKYRMGRESEEGE